MFAYEISRMKLGVSDKYMQLLTFSVVIEILVRHDFKVRFSTISTQFSYLKCSVDYWIMKTENTSGKNRVARAVTRGFDVTRFKVSEHDEGNV